MLKGKCSSEDGGGDGGNTNKVLVGVMICYVLSNVE